MIRSILLICFIHVAGSGFGQSSPSGDTSRVRLLLSRADAIIYEHPDSSIYYTDVAMELSEMLHWQKGIALALRQKGNVYNALSDNLRAMDYYQKAMTAGESLHSRQFDASIYNNVANIFSDMGQFQKALEYYGKYLAMARELKQKKDETIALINMGTVYTEQKDYPHALDNFNRSLTIARQDSNTKLIPFILNNIGITLDKKGDYRNALANFQESIRFAGEANDPNARAPALEGISKTYLHLQDYTTAGKYARQSLALAEKANLPEWKQNAWEALSMIYEKQHKYDSALDAYKNYIIFRDSVMNAEKKSELARKEAQFEYEKKEAALKAERDKQQELANSKINRQRVTQNLAVGGAAVLFLAALSSFIFYKRRRDAEEQKKEAEFKVKVTDTEMKVLRLQMNPHFIFNCLGSIGDYIAKHDMRLADVYLTKFSGLMRLILENSEQKEVRLSDDLKALELYMQLESVRLNHSFTYEIMVDKTLDPENVLVPPLILQPFVENSIWHGFATKEGEGKICIEIKREGEMLNCIVEDNGVGRSGADTRADKKDRKPLGMKITRARIEIINEIKKSNASVKSSDQAQGVRVEVRLPMNLIF